MGRPLRDLTGQRFGRWTVQGRAEGDYKRPHWHCTCDCGSQSIVVGQELFRGKSQSCGCAQRSATPKAVKAPKALPEVLAVPQQLTRSLWEVWADVCR